jgi:hypothetical protein
MAEMTSFTVEGDATFGRFDDGNHVRIDDERVEDLIAKAIGFPTDEEFDQMIGRLNDLREQGLAPADGEPDILREGMKLRISVEVI